MARVVTGGPIAAFARINPHAVLSTNFDFFQNRIQQAYGTNSELGAALVQSATRNTELFNGFAAVTAAKAAAAQVAATMGNNNFIYHLNTIEQFQTAGLNMVNWIMTDPHLRQLYHRGVIEGWADTYVDLYPHETGESSTAYMLLNNGLFVPDEESGWKYFNYGTIYDNYETLTIQEVDAIKSAQQRLAQLIELGGQDPTSQYGKMLD